MSISGITTEGLTKIFEQFSTWLHFCADTGMTLDQFADKFDKFLSERIEGIKREETQDGT